MEVGKRGVQSIMGRFSVRIKLGFRRFGIGI